MFQILMHRCKSLWLSAFAAMFLLGLSSAEAYTANLMPTAPNSASHSILPLPNMELGQSRRINRQLNAHTFLFGNALSSPKAEQLGVLHQAQSYYNELSIMTWLFAVIFMAVDVAAIGGNIFSLATHRQRMLWGIIGVTSGGLSLIWGFMPLAFATPLLALPLFVLGSVTLLLGILNLAFMSRRGRYHHRHRPHRYRRYESYQIQPWFNASSDGSSSGGWVLVGRF